VRHRDFIIPVGLLALIAGFFVVQLLDVQKSRSSRVATASTPAIAPQGRVSDTSTASATPTVSRTDTAALEVPGRNVTIRPSSAPPPQIDTQYVRELLREGSPGTYLPEILAQQRNNLLRWPDRSPTMRVWIQRDPAVPNWNRQYTVVAEQAFAEWQEAGFPLRFDMVLDPSSSEIQIKWIEKFRPEDSLQVGVARKVRDQHGWLVSAEISIATHDTDGDPLTPALIAGVARHEIGHALGLGHSGSTADVMYPESHTTVISTADRKTLRLLYMLPPGRMP
jgi:hypothetical protein